MSELKPGKVRTDPFYSNCFIEMVKAKIRDPRVKVMYIPARLKGSLFPHWMWMDDDGEHDFSPGKHIPWYRLLWHKGRIRTVRYGCYRGVMLRLIDSKYYCSAKEDE